MQEVGIVRNEKDLLEYFQWLRLTTAKSLNDQNIEANKTIKEEKKTLGGTMKNFGNFLKRGIGQYEKKDESLNDELNSFNSKHPTHLSETEAQDLMNLLFENDQTGLLRLMMGINVVLDSEYSYKYEKEGLEAVSDVLYGNKNEISKIKKQLEENYNAISPKALSMVQKGALMGIATVSLAAAFMLPIFLGGGIVASTTGLAANATMESLAMSAALTGMAFGGMKLYNTVKVKQEFKKLNPEENALYLAIQCTYVQRASKTMDDQRFKEVLDQILKSLATLKQDLDYYLFIEKESTEANKKKLKSFHDFDGRLSEILEL